MIDYLKARIRSFGYAFRGVRILVSTQPHARLHLLATVSVVAGGYLLKFRNWEWVSVLVCIGMVWMAEAMNTALEFLADEISLERRERIGRAKDVAAAGVLMAAIASAVVAIVIVATRFRE